MYNTLQVSVIMVKRIVRTQLRSRSRTNEMRMKEWKKMKTHHLFDVQASERDLESYESEQPSTNSRALNNDESI